MNTSRFLIPTAVCHAMAQWYGRQMSAFYAAQSTGMTSRADLPALCAELRACVENVKARPALYDSRDRQNLRIIGAWLVSQGAH